jgi:hypothetical protein
MKYLPLTSLIALAACSSPQPQPPQIVKLAPTAPASETWASQEAVTNVQDWDRMAARIAHSLQNEGFLVSRATSTANRVEVASAAPGAAAFEHSLTFEQPRTHRVSVNVGNNSMFLRQLRSALQHEIIRRGDPANDINVDLSVGVVSWGSRLHSQPYEPRLEAVWQATVTVDGKPTASFREPFYIFASDFGLYTQLPPSPPSPDQELASTARALHYTTK